MNLLTHRLSYLYAFLSTLGLFVVAFYLQYGKGIAPCPLCILQRLMLAVLGIIFFFGWAYNFKKMGRIIVGTLSFLFSALGALLAGRQVWIQHLPADKTPDCGVSLEYMLHVLPIDQVAKRIFEGTAECSLVDWSFFNLSLADWTLICFILFGCFSIWQLVRKYS
jgi:disulfide bond formation protein DsbB